MLQSLMFSPNWRLMGCAPDTMMMHDYDYDAGSFKHKPGTHTQPHYKTWVTDTEYITDINNHINKHATVELIM